MTTANRERLTPAQIEQGWRDTFSTENPYCPCDLKTFTKAVRWAESRAPAASVGDAPQEGSWIAAGDVQRLVRELDAALNGEEGAAAQASLCDVVAQVKQHARLHGPLLVGDAPSDAVADDERAWGLIALAENNGATRDSHDDGSYWTLDLAAWKGLDAALSINFGGIYTAPPAAPVVSAQSAWDHLCENSYDHNTPGMICIPTDEWKVAEKMMEAALSVPATDDKAPAVDAEAICWVRPYAITYCFAKGTHTTAFPKWQNEGDIPLYAAPTSPHDVDAADAALRLGVIARDLVARFDRQHPRAMKLLRKGEPFFVVKASEPYAWDLVRLIRANEGDGWTAECQEWAEEAIGSPEPPHDVDAVRGITDAQCEAVFRAVTMANITRDVKSAERKCEIVREALTAALRKSGGQS